MRQIIFDFGVLRIFGLSIPLHIYGYGLMLVLGFLLGIALAQRRARRMGENPEAIMHCGLFALIGGVVGARLAFVIEQWHTFRNESVFQVLNVTSGGLIYYGGVVLATIMVLAYLKYKRFAIRRYLDIIAPSLMIGLAFGRAGCTLNGCCYGGPASDSWPLAMRFPMYSKPLIKLDGRKNPWSLGQDAPSPVYMHQLETGLVHPDKRLIDTAESRWALIPPREFSTKQIAVAEHEWSQPVKPAQPLGLLNALLLACLLMAFSRLRRREGQVFALLVILYPITRFVLESIRGDNPHDILHGVLTHNQYTSLVITAAGVIMMVALHYMPPSTGPTWSERLAAEAGASAEATSRPRRRSKKK